MEQFILCSNIHVFVCRKVEQDVNLRRVKKKNVGLHALPSQWQAPNV
jgi:hypothetical protein